MDQRHAACYDIGTLAYRAARGSAFSTHFTAAADAAASAGSSTYDVHLVIYPVWILELLLLVFLRT